MERTPHLQLQPAMIVPIKPGVMRLKSGVMLAGLLSVSLLSGCAAQKAYHEAQQFDSAGNIEASLASYQKSLQLAPDSVEYKAGYQHSRERFISSLLLQANRLLEQGQFVQARPVFQRALKIDPENVAAQSGIESINRAARHEDLLKAANEDVQNKQNDAAREKLKQILLEDPKNLTAGQLLQTLDARAVAPVESLLSAAYKTPISISFRDAPLKQVFDIIASTSGLNILFDKDVKFDQKTSIYLKNSTTEAAIYYMLMTNHLEQQVMDSNTLLIYPNTPDKQKDYQQLLIKTFHLQSAKASVLAETLKTLLKLHDIVVDDKLNLLIVRDNADALRLAEKLIATQDVAEPEVMLEVEVLEVTRNKLLNLGVNLPGSLTLTPLPATGLTLSNLVGLNKQTIGASLSPLVINANQTDTDADLLANPRIRVLNHEKAKIMIGNKVPVITTTAVANIGVSDSVSYIDVGLKVDVEPTIYLDNDVAIRIGLEVSSIVSTQTSPSGTVTYTIGTRTANTMLRLKDGETQVLAGLLNNEERNTGAKFPGLGDIPGLGRLFGTNSKNGLKTEIVLSITPHLIRNIKRPEAATLEYLSGTETSMRHKPDLTPKVLNTTLPAPLTPAPEPLKAAPVPVATESAPAVLPVQQSSVVKAAVEKTSETQP